MKKIGFIGAFDKSNLIMYVAKTLRYLDKRVIIVDTTQLQKMKYIVPSINPTKTYITELETIDFAVGFKNVQQIEKYMEIDENNMPYDYMLIDIDSEEALEEFDIQSSGNNYFVTGFDMYSLRRGLSIFESLKEPINLTKILCRYELLNEDEDYLNYLSMEYKINWNDFSIYIPCIDEDLQMIEENQKVYKIRMKRLSNEFQEGIMYIVQNILGEKNLGKIKKSIKE